jgi:hypothetical protein
MAARVGLGAEPVLVAGVGQSALAEARAAGLQAALAAKAGLGDTPAKLVVVFAARRQVVPELVAGVGEVFDAKLIHGGEGYSPVSGAGNFTDQGHNIANGVAVLALGGALEVTVATDAVRPDDKAERFVLNGQRLGEQLKPAASKPAKGRLLFTFGNQHVGDNQPMVGGLLKALGENLPAVGAANGGPTAKEIVAGKIVTGVNVVVLLRGEFTLGVAMATPGGDLVAKTGDALKTACAARTGTPALVLMFNCGGRRGELVKQQKLADEFAKMKELVPTAPLFGLYGGGEVVTERCGVAAKGVGYSVATAALFGE